MKAKKIGRPTILSKHFWTTRMEITCCFCCEDYRLIFEDEYGNDEQSTYKCCQGAVHIKAPLVKPFTRGSCRATMYVGISAILLSIFSAVCMFFGIYSVNLWLDIALIILNTIVAIILLIGLYYEKAILMLPFIVTEIVQCALFFILATYTLYFMLAHERKFLRKFDQMLMVISIYVGIIVAGSAIWVAAKCYHYLKAKEQGLIECSPDMERNRRTIRRTSAGYWL